ncbi:HNH endonuclease [Acinetobacter sp. TY2]|uniref:HNH endonuclease n=1 Tax=Acinetobacter sp. TY2 TaxID=3387403 RepID=UPI0039177E97
MSEFKCVLCSTQITEENNTKEHIIPNSIGGKKKIRNFICNDCNNKTGENWDSELAKIFAPFCTMFGIIKDRGEVPPLRVKTISGVEYKQFSDGTFQALNPSLSIIKKEENSFDIAIQARTVNEANKMLKGIEKKYKFKKETIQSLQEQIVFKDSYLNEPIIHNFTFDSEKSGRSAIKSALALATSGGINPFDCDLAINFLVNDGEPNFGYYDCNDDLVKNRELGCPFHTVYIHAIKEKGQILAYIEYFGYQRIVACMSNNYLGETKQIIYTINPMTGKEIDLIIDLNFTPDQIEKINNYEMYKQESVRLSFGHIMDRAISYSREREFERAFKKAFEYTNQFHDTSLSHEENCEIKAQKIAESLQPYIQNLIKKAP